MNDHDHTFTTVSMYGSTAWAATVMGVSRDTFYRSRCQWETEGFPPPDPINKHYIKADVETWIANRRRVADKIGNHATVGHFNNGKANLDAL
jgi:hypothetical protein